MQEKHFAEAIVEFTHALEINSDLVLALNARGYSHFRLKHYELAMADLNHAIELNPNYANAYFNRSGVRAATGDKSGAAADLAKSRELAK
jgi:Flp pilus assembly protein TadD